MATSNSALSFQGLSTGLQTDALVNAIIAQQGKGLEALTARQTRNNARSTALSSMKSGMNAVLISLAAFQDKLNSRTVTSTDVNNTNVSATAVGAAAGSYDLKVTTVATKGRISSNLDVDGNPTNMAVANPANAIFTGGGGKASFAVRGTDGVLKAFELTTNSLNGLRDAINASGSGVTATVVNTGSASNPYQLVITAKETGAGTTAGVVTLAAIANADATVATVDSGLGITTGSISGTIAAPGTLTGGLSSSASGVTGVNADFTLNGIQLHRQTNVVTDAVDGVTFTLKQGAQTGTTTLTVAQDKTSATVGMQDVITKFNALVTAYKTASGSTKDTNGTILPGVLAGDPTSRTIVSQLRSTLTGASSGLPGTSAFQNLSSIGVKTNADGTLSLNTVTFQAALEKDPTAVQRLFKFSGDSSNGVLSFSGATAATATGPVGFAISNYLSDGSFTASFTGTANGPYTLQGTNGTVAGAAGTDLEGLSLLVTGNGSGTLTLTRGAGLAVSDLVSKFTATGTGALSTSLTSIRTQNTTLGDQIAAAQSALDRRKKGSSAQFSKMEVVIAQLKASGGSLSTQ